jgi:phospholipid-binding lipoprotein MlaA
VPNGPFLFLPITGPTTVRDLFGGAIDRLILPFTFGRRVTKPEFVIPFATLSVLDHRSEFDDTLKKLHENVDDPYANSRTFYLQRRQAEIDALRRGEPLVGGMTEPPADVDARGRPVRAEEPAVGTPAPVEAPGGQVLPAGDAPSVEPVPAAANDNGNEAAVASDVVAPTAAAAERVPAA